ncbi:hypothetical protein JQ617_07920 [Bradyrhizobium sp. KB893862 SZCCT0404]|uniref:hypothetical protein n=1 Tax=Bradyrhizobium sp. KB893862 SZCCT0404 TaxID=2807672 RepID=UPI001BA6D0FA|nr:hypothetical protein [Bradyrhizobium sp. KB893862 SZCCT0404]MBR1173877.1 hypothetical protein [Bradyrhizobium sp. KB893862 SZCCT0404]
MFELYLIHGRNNPEQSMDNWGFDGPRLQGVTGLHQTYGNAARVVFADDAAMEAARALTGWDVWDECQLEMRWHDDMVVTNTTDGPSYYGDWGIWLKEQGK